jgi:hypothetical protein
MNLVSEDDIHLQRLCSIPARLTRCTRRTILTVTPSTDIRTTTVENIMPRFMVDLVEPEALQI